MSNSNNLHTYIDEILISLEEIRQKRDIMAAEIADEDHELVALTQELDVMTKRLDSINETIHRENNRKKELEKTISETESTKSKVSFIFYKDF